MTKEEALDKAGFMRTYLDEVMDKVYVGLEDVIGLIEEIYDDTKATEEKWNNHDSTLKIGGKPWRCECRCNVGRFNVDKTKFKCNGCEMEYDVR